MSSLTKEGLPELWSVMKEFHETMIRTGELMETRRKQQRIWMWSHITQHIMQVGVNYHLCSIYIDLKNVSIQVFREDPRVKTRIAEMERQVEQGVITAGQAAEVLLHYFVPGTKVMP